MISTIKYYVRKFIRQGATFKNILNELELSKNYTQEQLTKLQNDKLSRLVNHCYKNVPYYRDLFRQLNLTPEDIAVKNDLIKLPYIDKHVINENFDKLIDKRRLHTLRNIATTSGTTGTPTTLLRDHYSINFEQAALHRYWRKIECKDLKKVTLTGELFIPVNMNTAPFWKYNQIDKDLIMSSYHLTSNNADAYIKKILDFEPDMLVAFASAAYLLARYFKAAGQKIKLKAVITTAERLEEKRRELIKEVFNCNVYDWYGQAERVALILQCEKGNYHIVEDYSITELIECDPGYEIVGTNLNNYLMPLLRYRTNDHVRQSNDNCSCNSSFRTVSEIYGRSSGCYVYTDKGLKVTSYSKIPIGTNNICEAQFIQEKVNELTINVTTNADFSDRDKNRLIENAYKLISPDIKVTVNQVDNIPRGPNGKFQSVINKVKNCYL